MMLFGKYYNDCGYLKLKVSISGTTISSVRIQLLCDTSMYTLSMQKPINALLSSRDITVLNVLVCTQLHISIAK